MKNRLKKILEGVGFLLLGIVIYWLATMLHLVNFDETLWGIISIAKGILLTLGFMIALCGFVYIIYQIIIRYALGVNR